MSHEYALNIGPLLVVRKVIDYLKVMHTHSGFNELSTSMQGVYVVTTVLEMAKVVCLKMHVDIDSECSLE
jgi:hypothetical protein